MSKETIAAELNTTVGNIGAKLDSALTHLGSIVDAVTAVSEEVSSITTDLEALNGLTDDILALKVEVPAPTWKPRFAGDTKPGTIRWGCSYNSNAVPTPHETAAGVPVGVRRTFWDMSKTAGLLSAVKADHAAGRVPWVSVKLGTTWQNVSNGTSDVALKKLIADLKATGKPVWFTAHHEPEGGNGTAYPDDGQGTEVHWRNMQSHIRTLIGPKGTSNIAFASTLMAWTFDSRSGRKPADWWVDDIWDFAGIDNYVEADATTVQSNMWKNTLAFYQAKGLPIALGEWGNKDHGPSGAAEMQDWYNHLISIGSPGACYFDTSLNGGKPLSAEALTKFRELMKVPTSVTGV